MSRPKKNNNVRPKGCARKNSRVMALVYEKNWAENFMAQLQNEKKELLKARQSA